jgi:signal transduction histidine kinase
MLLAIILVVFSVVSLGFEIIMGAGYNIPQIPDEIETWFMAVSGIVVLTAGAGIIALFSLVVNKTIIARIRKLKDMAGKVATGDFDAELTIKGYDELSELADSFNKMASELRANEYLSKEFARNVSHEFKTPLSIIHGYAELLEGSATDNDGREKLKIIIQETERLSGISKSLLELSALDSTTIIKQEDTFSPAVQIKTVLQTSQMLWQAKNIDLDLDLNDFSIKSNETLLYRVWHNLISNAIKFTGSGGTIKISLAKTGKGFIFEIADNGIGISDADKGKIFSQFFVGDKSRNSEGSGLGLALARKIVEKMGGSMRFESKQGHGTKFTAELPTDN